MNGKILKLTKKVVALLIIALICSSTVVSAFSFETGTVGTTSGGIKDFFSKIFKEKSFNIEDLQKEIKNMESKKKIDIDKINELIKKLPNGDDKMSLEYIMKIFTGSGNNDIDMSALINTLKEKISSISIGGGSKLPVEPKSVNMDANTAVKFAGEDYAAKLHANVYMHVDENGKEDSDKWALLIHPFMLKGTSIAGSIGPYYYEKGYNIIAPDLRGFGDSEGKCAVGFMESLDMYDWLNYINDNYNPKQVFVHGISLGGATTNYLSGIDRFLANGPTKVDTSIKSLRSLHVIGLVEDCGYTKMTEFASQSSLEKMGITGLSEENFEYYSDATNSLKYCDIPMLIIHGTKDSTVKPENADIVKNTVKGETEQWLVDGASHAFIIMGSNTDEYKSHVQAFIDKYEDATTASKPIEKDETSQNEIKPTETNTNKTTNSFLDKILKKLKSIKK